MGNKKLCMMVLMLVFSTLSGVADRSLFAHGFDVAGPDSSEFALVSDETPLLPENPAELPIPDFTPAFSPDALGITAGIVNPNMNLVARWDTADINMYHVDMTTFKFKVDYELQNLANGKRFVLPVNGPITSGFGPRRLFGRHYHFGIDLDLETGDPVYAAMDGTVRISRYNRGYGNMVVISHEGGMETLYGHLTSAGVAEGQTVKAGDLIGLGGSTGQTTGPHLHFEIRVFGEQIDPARVIDVTSGTLYTNRITVDATWFDHLLNINNIRFHVVKQGETLETLSELYGVEISELEIMNDLEAGERIRPGQRIRLGEAE